MHVNKPFLIQNDVWVLIVDRNLTIAALMKDDKQDKTLDRSLLFQSIFPFKRSLKKYYLNV